jgi:SAM-dependent methyltransferase
MAGGAQNRDFRNTIYQSYDIKKRPSIAYTERYARSWAATYAARLHDWLPADRQTPVLDLGCGPGYMLYLLDRLGYSDLTGVDLSPARVAAARWFCPRAQIIQGDVRETLVQNPGRFGVITGMDFLEHFRKDEIFPLLTLVARALRGGGRLILQTLNAGSPWVGGMAYGDFTHEWFFTPESLSEVLEQVGLTGFSARPCRPRVHGPKSFLRAFLWNFLDLAMVLINLIETGEPGSGINTRNFLATATKPLGKG